MEFPFKSFFEEEPEGFAVAFHLDGRGIGIVRSICRDILPHLSGAKELADYWEKITFPKPEPRR